MAPKQHPTAPDQFEIYNELVRRSRRSFLLSGVLVVITLGSLALAFVSLVRPLPVVVTSDNPLEPRRIVAAGDASVREIDAKRFFATTARRLHGWSSMNAVNELTDASMTMTTRWRKRFAAEMNGEVTVPESIDASGKTTLLQTYVLAKIRNELDVDWETVSCAKEARAWHCKASATMKILPLGGDPVEHEKLTKRLSIRATFVEVAVTKTTIDGLLVDFWDAQIEEKS